MDAQTEEDKKDSVSGRNENDCRTIQKKYGFVVDKWITIREKNNFGML